jgi:hypothetical protein
VRSCVVPRSFCWTKRQGSLDRVYAILEHTSGRAFRGSYLTDFTNGPAGDPLSCEE